MEEARDLPMYHCLWKKGGESLAAVEAVSAETIVAAAAQQENNNDNDPTAIIVTEHVSSSFNWIQPILCFTVKMGYK